MNPSNKLWPKSVLEVYFKLRYDEESPIYQRFISCKNNAAVASAWNLFNTTLNKDTKQTYTIAQMKTKEKLLKKTWAEFKASQKETGNDIDTLKEPDGLEYMKEYWCSKGLGGVSLLASEDVAIGKPVSKPTSDAIFSASDDEDVVIQRPKKKRKTKFVQLDDDSSPKLKPVDSSPRTPSPVKRKKNSKSPNLGESIETAFGSLSSGIERLAECMLPNQLNSTQENRKLDRKMDKGFKMIGNHMAAQNAMFEKFFESMSKK